jgi:prepilin-type N-terminal cleavage/methylation domain-containing protein
MNPASAPTTRRRSGFSLVEVLAAVTIIGIIAFLALPNIIAMKKDSEVNLAISRAEAVNMAIASFIQANGRDRAVSRWSGASASDQAKYNLIGSYLAFAPANETDYMPSGYDLTWPSSIAALGKIALKDPDNVVVNY